MCAFMLLYALPAAARTAAALLAAACTAAALRHQLVAAGASGAVDGAVGGGGVCASGLGGVQLYRGYALLLLVQFAYQQCCVHQHHPLKVMRPTATRQLVQATVVVCSIR
jgi:hypothetical protein